jgi:hypothetical protein
MTESVIEAFSNGEISLSECLLNLLYLLDTGYMEQEEYVELSRSCVLAELQKVPEDLFGDSEWSEPKLN